MVTTSLVNEGLGAQPGRDLLVADDAQTTARQIVALLTNPSLREQIGRTGRLFVEQRYSWSHAVDRMRAIEERLWRSRDSAGG